jgi:hypothetical protein
MFAQIMLSLKLRIVVGSIVGYVRFSPVFNATKVVCLFFTVYYVYSKAK